MFEELAPSLGATLYAPAGVPDPSRPFVRMAVNPFSIPNPNSPLIDRTIQTFVRVFGRNNFEARIISDTAYASAPEDVDLMLGSAGTYLKGTRIGAHALATLISGYFPNPNFGEGAVFIALKERAIRSFEDMKGTRAVFLDVNAFSGYAVALGEIARRGFDPDRFFSEKIFADASMPQEIDLLRQGAADVAVVRTCFLEELKSRGIPTGDLVPVGLRHDLKSDFRCLSSTALYPNWTLFSTPRATPEIARTAAAALLNMPADPSGLRWGIASDFTEVDRLYRAIRLGPYESLRTWSWNRLWEDYRTEISCGILLLVMLVVYALVASAVIRVRTAALRTALDEQVHASQRARLAQDRLEAMQRAAVISQMSYAIAHNLKQPLGAIVNFAHGILRLLDSPGPVERDLVIHGVRRIGEQAQLADDIVRSVRGYAGRAGAIPQPVDIVQCARRALQTLLSSKKYAGRVKTDFPETAVVVTIDPAELEVMVINLVKNALEAVSAVSAGTVELSLAATQQQGADGRSIEHVDLRVQDNGPRLRQEEFDALGAMLVSSKTEGMGLGIPIVRMIAEKYGGCLRFHQPDAGDGLCAQVVMVFRETPQAVNKSGLLEHEEKDHAAT